MRSGEVRAVDNGIGASGLLILALPTPRFSFSSRHCAADGRPQV